MNTTNVFPSNTINGEVVYTKTKGDVTGELFEFSFPELQGNHPVEPIFVFNERCYNVNREILERYGIELDENFEAFPLSLTEGDISHCEELSDRMRTRVQDLLFGVNRFDANALGLVLVTNGSQQGELDTHLSQCYSLPPGK